MPQDIAGECVPRENVAKPQQRAMRKAHEQHRIHAPSEALFQRNAGGRPPAHLHGKAIAETETENRIELELKQERGQPHCEMVCARTLCIENTE